MTSQLSILNPTPNVLPGPKLLHELVATQSKGGVPAIEHTLHDGSKQAISYHELRLQSDRLASQLRSIRSASTIANNERFIVPLYIEQCPDLYVAQLAILKAGGAFCPIALDAPEDRIRFILQDIEASILLTTSQLSKRLPVLDSVNVTCVDDDMSGAGHDNPSFPIDPSQAAYIMCVACPRCEGLKLTIHDQVY